MLIVFKIPGFLEPESNRNRRGVPLVRLENSSIPANPHRIYPRIYWTKRKFNIKHARTIDFNTAESQFKRGMFGYWLTDISNWLLSGKIVRFVIWRKIQKTPKACLFLVLAMNIFLFLETFHSVCQLRIIASFLN